MQGFETQPVSAVTAVADVDQQTKKADRHDCILKSMTTTTTEQKQYLNSDTFDLVCLVLPSIQDKQDIQCIGIAT